MRSSRTKIATAAVIGLGALGAGVASAASTKVYVDSCGHIAKKPTAIRIGCGVDSQYWTHLHWVKYGTNGAKATGQVRVPGAGPWSGTLNLSKPTRYKGKLVFDKATWRVPKGPGAIFPPGSSAVGPVL